MTTVETEAEDGGGNEDAFTTAEPFTEEGPACGTLSNSSNSDSDPDSDGAAAENGVKVSAAERSSSAPSSDNGNRGGQFNVEVNVDSDDGNGNNSSIMVFAGGEGNSVDRTGHRRGINIPPRPSLAQMTLVGRRGKRKRSNN